MIIAFEGQPYAGKTTLIHDFRNSSAIREHIVCIPEIVLHSIGEVAPCCSREIEREFYLKNDLIKSEMCDKSAEAKLILIDRYFVSTILCNMLISDIEPSHEEIESNFRRYEGAVIPDLIVFVDTIFEVLEIRANLDLNKRINGPWTQPRSKIALYYNAILSFLEKNEICRVTKLRHSASLNAKLTEQWAVLAKNSQN